MSANFTKIWSGMNLGSQSSDPASPNEGDFYTNSSTSKVKIYINGAWRELVTNTDTQTFTNKKFDDALLVAEIASPSTPASGYGKIYFKSDNALYVKNDAGTESLVVTGSAVTQYDRIVANPAITGFSTDTTIGSAITNASAGDEILVMNGTYTEDVTVSKQLRITGQGRGTVISGNVTFNSSSDYSTLTNVKFTGNLTIDSGSLGNRIVDCFVLSTMVYTENDTTNSNFVSLTEE